MDWSPVTVISIGIVGGVVLLVLLAVYTLMRAFNRGIRRGPKHVYEPLTEPNPPEAVVVTGPLRTLAWAALAWALFNGLMMVIWLVTGSHLIDPAVQWLLSLYVIVSSGSVLVGAVMLLAGRRYGRRGVAWGCMLMGVMAFCGAVMFVVLKYDPESQKAFRDVAVVTTVFLTIHVVADILLGALAQRVGLAPHEMEPEDAVALPEPTKAPYD
jgi:hypothetical protein